MSTGEFTSHLMTTVESLEQLYGAPGWLAVAKELDHLSKHYRAFVEAAPFCVVATSGPDGLDCSPRGDLPGFVRVHDPKTLLIPDRRGNNRIDSLHNIVHDPRVALLFLIPGCGETLRVNGRAAISRDPALLESFAVAGKAPRTVLVVAVERVFYQCANAILRAKLWDFSQNIDRSSLPSTNAMLASIQWRNLGRTLRPRTTSTDAATIHAEAIRGTSAVQDGAVASDLLPGAPLDGR